MVDFFVVDVEAFLLPPDDDDDDDDCVVVVGGVILGEAVSGFTN